MLAAATDASHNRNLSLVICKKTYIDVHTHINTHTVLLDVFYIYILRFKMFDIFGHYNF